MNLLRAFKYSLSLPKKDAMFRLNRMGMGNTVGYVFILMLVAAIPPGIRFALSNYANITYDISPTEFILQFVIFYYAMFAFMGLLVISALAGLSFGLSKILNRKLRYQQLWKLSAYAATLPALLFTLSEGLNLTVWMIPTILFLFALFLLWRIILVFPPRKK